jgi:peptidoglycan hydrolase-like protein with peptidoglycan-binding domain
MVGQICRVDARIESSDPAEGAIAFPEELFDLLSPTKTVRVPAGAADVAWTLYARIGSAEPVILGVQASAAGLYQAAELRVRINTNADS